MVLVDLMSKQHRVLVEMQHLFPVTI
jgi:hypothetical protein